MANKNEVTITLDEYKELLLKDKPNNKDTMLLERIKELLYYHIKYEKDWNDNVTIDFKYDSKFCEELITTIKVIDKEFYKEMLKYVCDEKAKKDAEKARAIKELNPLNFTKGESRWLKKKVSYFMLAFMKHYKI